MVIKKDSKTITIIQVLVIVAAIAYCVAPELILGPLDDMLVGAIAIISELVLGFIKPHITVVPNPD